MSTQPPALETRAVHAGKPRPGIHGAVITPIFQTANYEMDGDAEPGYIRYGNTPNHESLAAKIAALENAEAGFVTGSGMAATSAALLGHLRAGDHVLAQNSLYGGTYNLLTQHLPALGITATFIDPDRPDTWKDALRPTTRLLWCESITNPLVEVPDLASLASFALANGLVAMIDNTFASPVNFNPVTLGFDLVMHSATKYLNGHSDIVAGALAGKRVNIDKAARSLRALGGALDPHACFLLDRGIKTMCVRVRHQNAGAMRVAGFLQSHRRVARVNYPGLDSSASHARAKTLLRGFGGMLSFELAGDAPVADRFLSRVRVPIVAGSLGGTESLLVRPATSSHRSVPREQREAMGIRDGLIRMSVGLESPDDLVRDLDQALAGL